MAMFNSNMLVITRGYIQLLGIPKNGHSETSSATHDIDSNNMLVH